MCQGNASDQHLSPIRATPQTRHLLCRGKGLYDGPYKSRLRRGTRLVSGHGFSRAETTGRFRALAPANSSALQNHAPIETQRAALPAPKPDAIASGKSIQKRESPFRGDRHSRARRRLAAITPHTYTPHRRLSGHPLFCAGGGPVGFIDSLSLNLTLYF